MRLQSVQFGIHRNEIKPGTNLRAIKGPHLTDQFIFVIENPIPKEPVAKNRPEHYDKWALYHFPVMVYQMARSGVYKLVRPDNLGLRFNEADENSGFEAVSPSINIELKNKSAADNPQRPKPHQEWLPPGIFKNQPWLNWLIS